MLPTSEGNDIYKGENTIEEEENVMVFEALPSFSRHDYATHRTKTNLE